MKFFLWTYGSYYVLLILYYVILSFRHLMILISSFLEQVIPRLVEIQTFAIEFNDINYLIAKGEVVTEKPEPKALSYNRAMAKSIPLTEV